MSWAAPTDSIWLQFVPEWAREEREVAKSSKHTVVNSGTFTERSSVKDQASTLVVQVLISHEIEQYHATPPLIRPNTAPGPVTLQPCPGGLDVEITDRAIMQEVTCYGEHLQRAQNGHLCGEVFSEL